KDLALVLVDLPDGQAGQPVEPEELAVLHVRQDGTAHAEVEVPADRADGRARAGRAGQQGLPEQGAVRVEGVNPPLGRVVRRVLFRGQVGQAGGGPEGGRRHAVLDGQLEGGRRHRLVAGGEVVAQHPAAGRVEGRAHAERVGGVGRGDGRRGAVRAAARLP